MNKTHKNLAMVIHDIKNSFNTPISGLNFLIKEYSNLTDREIITDLKEIKTNLERDHNYYTKLLEIFKLEDQKIYSPSYLNLNSIVNDSYNFLRSQFENKSVVFENKIPEKQFVYSDPNLTHILLMNLLGNAVKYSYNKGIVSVQGKIIGNSYETSVIDNGVGISGEKLETLFDNYQNSEEGTRGETGTGLGLVHCKYLVELQKGKIYVESLPNKGSKFSFTLPLKEK